tara:strand:- start:13377 stop:13727 length:351 start_codon:yes stop_codon:yes gene_type:complete
MTPREQAEHASKLFPARLKALRKSCGLTQDQLAELAECSTVALSKFETGVNLPSFDNLIALALSLNVSVDELLGVASEAVETNPNKAAARARLDRVVSDLSVDWIDAITEIAKKAK